MSERSTPPALQQALRTLLESPLLLEGMDGFGEVWAWRAEVRSWFDRHAAWTVQMGPGVLRLMAPSPHPDGGRALEELASSKAAALLAWVLWFHEYLGLRLGESKQFSLSEMSERIAAQGVRLQGHGPVADATKRVAHSGDAANLQSGLDFSELSSRRALVQAVRCAGRIGILNVLDDESSKWEGGEASAGALLEFTPGAAYLISRPPPQPPSAVQRAVRALLVGPVLVRAQDPQAFVALQHNQEFVIEDLQEALGWPVELQADYACLLRGGQTTGYAKRWSPGRSVIEAAAVLLVDAVRSEVNEGRLQPDADGYLRLSSNRLYGLMDSVREQYRQHWGEQGKQSSEKLLWQIEAVWQEWGALEIEEEIRILKPHLARFSANYYDPNQPPPQRKRVRGRRLL